MRQILDILAPAGSAILLFSVLTAIDHDHGFKIATYPDGAESNGTPGLVFTSVQDCLLLKKGETTTIEFIAQKHGTYPFRCCHKCGLGHSGMKGELIVE